MTRFCIFLLLLTSSCTCFTQEDWPQECVSQENPNEFVAILESLNPKRRSETSKEIFRVTEFYGEKVRKAHKLIPMSTGLFVPDKIRELTLSFRFGKELSLPEARKLFVEVNEGFIACVNGSENLRPWLEGYPEPFKNAKIDIYISDKCGSRFGMGKLALLEIIDGGIAYKVDYTKGKEFVRQVHWEPYEDALKIVRGEMADPYVPVHYSEAEATKH